MRSGMVMAAAVLFAACSGSGAIPEAAAPPQPEPFDPVGSYTFMTSFQGQSIGGGITIERLASGFGGEVTPDQGPPPVPIMSVSVEGREVTIVADAGGEDLVMILMVAEDGTYTGSWTLGFDGGDVTGEKLKA